MKRLSLTIALVSMLAAGSSAFGAVSLDWVGTGSPVGQVQIVGSGAAAGINGTYWAGWERISLNGGPVFQTMCIDMGDTAGDDANASLVALDLAPDAWAGPMGASAATTIRLLWGNYAAGAASSTLDAAALQIAIWKAIDLAMPAYGLTFTDGTAGAVARANFMLANLGTTSANLMAVTSRYQDFLVPVPEPTTVLAGALLLLPFAASTIRRFRKNS